MHKLGLVGESSAGAGELEGPQEVVSLLEVGTNSVNLMDKVSAALHTNRANSIFNNRVVSNGDALLVDLSEATFVDKLLHSGSRGVSVGYIRFNQTKHTDGRLVKLNKGCVVDLAKTEQLHNLLGLGRNANGTADTDDEGKLGHSGDIESSLGLGLTTVGYSSFISSLVFGSILLSLGDGIFLVLTLLLTGLVGCLLGLLSELGLSGLLLEDGFGDLGSHGGDDS